MYLNIILKTFPNNNNNNKKIKIKIITEIQ